MHYCTWPGVPCGIPGLSWVSTPGVLLFDPIGTLGTERILATEL